MTSVTHPEIAEKRESLWSLVASPAIWMFHFLASYTIGAVWCGHSVRGSSFGSLAAIFAALTIAALIGILWNARGAWRRYRRGDAVPSHEDDTPEDRHRFLGLASFLLSCLSGAAVVYSAIALVAIWDCS